MLDQYKTLFISLKDELMMLASSPTLYWDLGVCGAIILVSFLLKRLLSSPIIAFANRRSVLLIPEEALEAIIFPALTFLLFSLASSFAAAIHFDGNVLSFLAGMAFIWFLWKLLTVCIKQTLMRFACLWILLPYAFLKLVGWFTPVKEALIQTEVSVANIRVDAFMVINALLVMILIFWFGSALSKLGENYIRQNPAMKTATKELFVKLFDIVLYTALALFALDAIGIDVTTLAVFGGALGVGLGFGLQKIAANFVSGIIIISEGSITINHLIKLNDGTLGYVRKLGIRSCLIETFDGKEYLIPNEDLITSRVANLTHTNRRARVEITIGVSYDSDMNFVRELLLSAATNYERSSKKEGYSPRCFMIEYGDNSVNFSLTFWLDDVTSGIKSAKSDVMFRIWDLFKEHNIEIPYPQRDVHIRSTVKEVS